MILKYKKHKPEHIQQIMFGGFGKYEQINKLVATVKINIVTIEDRKKQTLNNAT